MKTSICLLSVIFLFASDYLPDGNVSAQTTYYFSTSGHDTSNGLSPSSPKKTLAALQILITSAQPGDQFLLKRGDVWTTRAGLTNDNWGNPCGLDIDSVKGTSDSLIIINTYGTGNKPIFNFSGKGVAVRFQGPLVASSPRYITIKNIHITSEDLITNLPRYGFFINGSNSVAGSPQHITIDSCVVDGVYCASTVFRFADYITIQNCEFKNSYGRQDSGGHGIGDDGNAIYSNTNNLKLLNNVFAANGSQSQLYLSVSENILVDGNTLIGTLPGRPYDGGIGMHLANIKNCVIRNNLVYDNTWLGIDVGDRYAGIVEGDTVGNWCYNNIIERNLIYSSPRGIAIQQQGGGMAGKGTSYLVIRNNIIYNSNVVGIRAENLGIFSNSSIVNNTLYNNFEGIKLASGPNYSNIIVKNNIIYNDTNYTGTVYLTRIGNSSVLNNVTLDYNLYYLNDTSNDTCAVVGNNRYSTLSAFKSAYPSEEVHGISDDPEFESPPSNISLNDGSPAIDEGLDLSGIVDDDFNGIERPLGDGYDIGAYEVTGSPDIYPPDAPTGLLANTDYNAIQVSWNASDSTDVMKYLIYKGSSGDTTNLSLIDSVVSTITSYEDPQSTQAVFYYGVKAKDESGNISYFSNVDSSKAFIPAAVADSITLTMSEGKDDGRWRQPSVFTSSEENMVVGLVSSYDSHSYYNFDSITVDLSGKTIDSVYLWISNPFNGNVDGVKWDIKMWDTSDVASPTSYAQAISFSKTTETISWIPTGNWIYNTPHKSPDLKTLLNELITSYGSSLRRLGFAFLSSSSTNSKTVYSIESNSTYKAYAKIYYTSSIPKINVFNEEPVPTSYSLLGNYPNPFNPATTISYTLPYQSNVALVIYDIMGREVKSFNISSQDAGYKNIIWDGRNNNGEEVSSGIYLYRLMLKSLENNEEYIKTAKLMMLK